MKVNFKLLNISAWLVIISTYILPSQNFGGFTTKFGYPFSFLTVYDTPLKHTLLSSCYINIFGLALDIMVFYFTITLLNNLYIKHFKTKL